MKSICSYLLYDVVKVVLFSSENVWSSVFEQLTNKKEEAIIIAIIFLIIKILLKFHRYKINYKYILRKIID